MHGRGEHIISVLPNNRESFSNKIVKVKRAASIDDIIWHLFTLKQKCLQIL